MPAASVSSSNQLQMFRKMPSVLTVHRPFSCCDFLASAATQRDNGVRCVCLRFRKAATDDLKCRGGRWRACANTVMCSRRELGTCVSWYLGGPDTHHLCTLRDGCTFRCSRGCKSGARAPAWSGAGEGCLPSPL